MIAPRVARAVLIGLTLSGSMLLAACSDDGGTATPAPPRVTPFVGAAPRDEVTPTVVTLPPGTPLSDERAREVLALLLDDPPDTIALAEAFEEIRRERDVRFVAPLIEIVRATNTKIVHMDATYVALLEDLTGLPYGRGWDRWAVWYGGTTLTPPPGFLAWKGELLAGIDPRFADFLREGVPSTIRIESVVWGSVPVDGITPLDQPPVLPAEAATYLLPEEPVFGLVVNGEARAYPFRIMDAHEMANDTLGGVPIALAYCTLCGTGIAYDRRGADGIVYSFSTSGLLYENNKLMYDRQTNTLWQQFTGRPAIGPLVEASAGTDGPWLNVLPVVVATWESWLTAHPETTVLDLETGIGSGYTPGHPYLQYFTSGDLYYPLSQRSADLIAKAWVFGLRVGEATKVYGLRGTIRRGVTNDRVGDVDVAVVGFGDAIEVAADGGPAGELTYIAGGEVRAYERPAGLNFAPGVDPLTVLDHRGRAWTVTEEALVGPDGERAPRLVGHISYWFPWYSAYPDTEIYQAP